MGINSYQRLSIKKRFLILLFSVLFASSAAIATTQSNQEINKKKALSLKEKANLLEAPSQKLLPMPLGQLDKASKKVRSSRDPFQNTPIIESNNIEDLKSALRFKGIAKSGNDLFAMIKTTKGQAFYKVGDSLGNGFFIKGISSKDVTVDISNGYRFYRLSLYSLNIDK
tara:strand:+ start:662 stop:1168 length:507 start_codon:yes stop_codon:yes gene_type:complete